MGLFAREDVWCTAAALFKLAAVPTIPREWASVKLAAGQRRGITSNYSSLELTNAALIWRGREG